MADSLYDLLKPNLKLAKRRQDLSDKEESEISNKYLSRLLSLRLEDLSTTEPQSLAQSSHSNSVSIQQLSSRSHRTTTASSDHLSTLPASLASLSTSVKEVRDSIPTLDESAVNFASTYARSVRNDDNDGSSAKQAENVTLVNRKDSALLARQSDKLADILSLPSLLSATIASAGTGQSQAANYSQALDLFAHIKRLQIIYPDSALIKSIQADAEAAMKEMTANLIASLQSQNIRLAAAIRTVGWLRRVLPEVGSATVTKQQSITQPSSVISPSAFRSPPASMQAFSQSQSIEQSQDEGVFGALFLIARLSTFLSMTEALAPLRDLADQETEQRRTLFQQQQQQSTSQSDGASSTTKHPDSSRRPAPQSGITSKSASSPSSSIGLHTERYLKRYIEIFREQTFNAISMYRNIFPPPGANEEPKARSSKDSNITGDHRVPDVDTASTTQLQLPSSLASFPLYLVNILMDTLKTYMPNLSDSSARESILMQVLYAANSLGRLGADFSMIIALIEPEMTFSAGAGVSSLDSGHGEGKSKDGLTSDQGTMGHETDGNSDQGTQNKSEPEWSRIIKKHRVQAARLESLASGSEQRRPSMEIPVS